MKSLNQALAFGLGLWLVRLASSAILSTRFFHARIGLPPYLRLDSGLSALSPPVIMAAATAFFTCLYFKDVEARFVREGVLLALIWTATNVGLDVPFLLGGPRVAGLLAHRLALPYPGGNIPFHYFRANALAYLLIPLLDVYAGYLLSDRSDRFVEGLIYGLVLYLARFVLFMALGFVLIQAGTELMGDAPGSGLLAGALFAASTIVVTVVAALFWFKNAGPDYVNDGFLLGLILLGLGGLSASVGSEWSADSLMAAVLSALIVISAGYLLHYRAKRRQSQAAMP